MEAALSKKLYKDLSDNTLVVFSAQTKKITKKGKEKKEETTTSLSFPKALPTTLKTFLQDNSEVATGAALQTTLFRNANVDGFTNVLAVGLGEGKKVTTETLRQAAAQAYKSLVAERIESATLLFESAALISKNDLAAKVIAEGTALASYSFDPHKKDVKPPKLQKLEIATLTKGPQKAVTSGLASGNILAGATNFARYLGDQPGNYITPTAMFEETKAAAKGTKLKVTAWNRAQIEKAKMGAFLSVNSGSFEEPRFIMMEYKGAAASRKPICLVGKGLTFDCGGISIKPSAAMEEMKYDMGGGAAVIGAMLAIARLKLKVNAIAYVPATDNMPTNNPNKPGDIVTARNGLKIEVNNTDAEGRLILSDALVYASEKKPAAIIDAATLTGAIIIALSNIHTGIFTRDDKLAAKMQKAADAADELVWRMPLMDEHSKDMKGTYADLSNTGKTRGAGSATAAAFLENFVDKDIPWMHCDVAGTAWNCGSRKNYHPAKGATGAMVRTFVELAKQF